MKVERMSPEEEYEENMKLMRKTAIVLELNERLSIDQLANVWSAYMDCNKCPYYYNCFDEDGKCINTRDCNSIIKGFIQTGEIR